MWISVRYSATSSVTDSTDRVRKVNQMSAVRRARLSEPSHSHRQTLAGAASCLQHPSKELDPMCHADVLNHLVLLRGPPGGNRLHLQPADSLSQIGESDSFSAVVRLPENVDIVPVRIHEGCANTDAVANLHTSEQLTHLLLNEYAWWFHENWLRCCAGGGYKTPLWEILASAQNSFQTATGFVAGCVMSSGTYASLSRYWSDHRCLCFSPTLLQVGLW